MKCSIGYAIMAAGMLALVAATPCNSKCKERARCTLAFTEAVTKLQIMGCGEKIASEEDFECHPAVQTSIDTAYKDCGGSCGKNGKEGFPDCIDFDTVEGVALKLQAETCKCSGAEVAAPVFALAAAAMAFFA